MQKICEFVVFQLIDEGQDSLGSIFSQWVYFHTIFKGYLNVFCHSLLDKANDINM